jgi:hypothetical protein
MADEKKIKESISRWNEVRNTIDGYNLLRSGSGIELKYEELQQLIKGDKDGDIHIYLGCTPIKETEMKITETRITETKETETKITETKITETKGGKRDMLFYFVDSANDVENQQIQQIITKKFVEPQIGNKFRSTTAHEPSQRAVKQNIPENKFFKEFNAFVEELMDFVQPGKDKKESENEKGEFEKKKKITPKNLVDDFSNIITSIDDNPDDRKIANDYLNSNLGSVLPTFLWLFYGNKWFEELQEDGNIVQVFRIGKNDFIDVYKALNGEGSAFLYLALKEKKKNTEKNTEKNTREKYKKEIDIYIAACQPENMNIDNDYASMIKHISADVATPCPPYCEVEDDDKDKDKDFPLLP